MSAIVEKKPLTLDQQIARLYKLGQKPVPYTSTTVTELMMTLYLNNKHNINDPSQKTIKEQYYAYGRISERMRAKAEKPMYCIWELYLFFDKNERLIGSNREEYVPALYWKIRDLIDANPGKKVVCPLNIAFFTNDEPTNGHLEILVYDPALNTLEHVDSNNVPKHRRRRDPVYFSCIEMCESVARSVSRMLEEKPLYINNDDIYTGYDFGVQSLEAASDLLNEEEKKGYCLMWAILFADLALKNPEYSIKQIVQAMMKKATSKMNKTEYSNDYLATLIRGYVVEVSNTLDVDFTDETSIHRSCINLSMEWTRQKQTCALS